MKRTHFLRLLFLGCLLVAVTGCHRGGVSAAANTATGPTEIEIQDTPVQSGVKRFGINLGGQTFYDSGQMMKNLIHINPGFEGETWQSILRCAGVTETSCTDVNQWDQWPQDFLKDASFVVLSGASQGVSGTVTSSDPADHTLQNQGVTIHFAAPAKKLELDSFVLVRKTIPGKPEVGWWPLLYGGATLVAETKDLSPKTPGHQALEIMAQGLGQGAMIASYFDSMKGHSFVQLRGNYRVTFRAKCLTGNRVMKVGVRRQADGAPPPFLEKQVTLTSSWQDYSFDFSAAEDGHAIGTVALAFDISGSTILLDDVSLEEISASKDNPTAFRDAVVDTLRALQPGILRYQDGDHIGSSIENWIAPPFARQRAGWTEGASEMTTIPVGLHEFLELCATVHAEPWINLPAGMTVEETRQLMEYFSGPATTPFGKKRAARGQTEPWTSVFAKIHLELGNEEWNDTTFAGAVMNDPAVYGQRARQIFTTARTSPYFAAQKFDLVLGSFLLNPDLTRAELAASGGYDSIAIAPYMFNRFNDDSSEEAIYGPMFAEPQLWDSTPKGLIAQHAAFARNAAKPAQLSVYEINLGTTTGTASQANVNRVVPSQGGAVALLDHMLHMLRDLGVKDQSVWALPGLQNQFVNTDTNGNETVPLYGTVLDMGGTTNRRRPQFLAEQMVNTALLPTMLKTQILGWDPTWDQEQSTNDDVALKNAHLLQTFAFVDGNQHSLVVINLSRQNSLPVSFRGDSPHGDVTVSHLDAKNITDTNETAENVRIVTETMHGFNPRSSYAVPPHSLTVFRWQK
jgi:alpha-L-arabinofuranosidase